MKRSKISLAIAAGATMLAAAATQPAFAGETKTKPILGIPSSAVADFGGVDGIHNWVESLFYYIMLDNRINYIFKEFGNADRQIALNTQLETMVLGGPNNYQGASMSAAHADLGITMTQFNAVVEAAYNACERNDIPYYSCNDLIAALAPFTRVIVTK
ncbi:group I truncated hemoglobin [Solimonas marina]|uniref:Group 1 truncated hemoglobin n=1 Tax=Solimonas marina TaxID=2714601 RepID=A0A969WAL6_9GAMM|nr:group 1 truncated hemoglobin [Solimonas marina]NKF23442.1 group 1 truncated hemoglobin [Solimonas marina]